MSFVPSPMQKEVIGHRKGSLLVAAAAGSGKTTTLIAHVLDRLKEKPLSACGVAAVRAVEYAIFVGVAACGELL